MFLVLCIVLCAVVSSQTLETHAAAYTILALLRPHTSSTPPAPSDILLDPRLPVQPLRADAHFTNYNVTFGSRFDFAISPGAASVQSGTDGVYHDNAASYVVGVMPADQSRTFMFHMGALNRARGDSYLSNERWIQGLDTTRWLAEVPGVAGMHVVVDFIAAFEGEPGCTEIVDCAGAVKDDTMPALIVGVLQAYANDQRRHGIILRRPGAIDNLRAARLALKGSNKINHNVHSGDAGNFGQPARRIQSLNPALVAEIAIATRAVQRAHVKHKRSGLVRRHNPDNIARGVIMINAIGPALYTGSAGRDGKIEPRAKGYVVVSEVGIGAQRLHWQAGIQEDIGWRRWGRGRVRAQQSQYRVRRRVRLQRLR